MYICLAATKANHVKMAISLITTTLVFLPIILDALFMIGQELQILIENELMKLEIFFRNTNSSGLLSTSVMVDRNLASE